MVAMYSPTIPLDQLTPEYVRLHYLTGLTLIGANGEELPDTWFVEHIANAIAKVEDITNVDILRRNNIKEKHDYHIGDYARYGFIQLFRIPAIEVTEIRAVYPTGQTIQVFPSQWVRLEQSHSQVHLVPTSGSLSQVVMGNGAEYLPLIFGSIGYLPQLWEVDYISGFDPEAVPRMVMDAVCKMASIEMLQIMADTVTPLGQTSQSLSIDGMSQSRSYALPAFKARIDKYSADLGLPASPGSPISGGVLAQIRNSYLGVNLASL